MLSLLSMFLLTYYEFQITHFEIHNRIFTHVNLQIDGVYDSTIECHLECVFGHCKVMSIGCKVLVQLVSMKITNRFECLFIVHINLSPIHFNDINVIL